MSAKTRYLLWLLVYLIIILAISFHDISNLENFTWYIFPVVGYNCWIYGAFILIVFIFAESLLESSSKKSKGLVIGISILLNFIVIPITLLPVDSIMVTWQKSRVNTYEYEEKQQIKYQKQTLEQFNNDRMAVESRHDLLIDVSDVENGKLYLYSDADFTTVTAFFENISDPKDNKSGRLNKCNQKSRYFDVFYKKTLSTPSNHVKEIFFHDGYIDLVNENNTVSTFEGEPMFDQKLTDKAVVEYNRDNPDKASPFHEGDIILAEKFLNENEKLKLFWYRSTENDMSSAIGLVGYFYNVIPYVLEYNSEWNLPSKIGQYSNLFLEQDNDFGNRITTIKNNKKIKFDYFITNDKSIGVKEVIQ